MFQRRVLPTEEELWDAVMPAAFAAAWYSSLFRMLLNGTTNAANMAVFLLGGILPLSAAFVKGRTVLACRKKRRGKPFPGGGAAGASSGASNRRLSPSPAAMDASITGKGTI